MRVAFDGRYITDSFGGVARFAFELVSALSALEDAPTVLFYHNPGARAERFDIDRLLGSPNVEPRPMSLPLYSLQEQLVWPRLLARDEADLFYSPYFALPLFASPPCIPTVHDLIFEQEKAYRRRPWVRGYYSPMMRLGLRKARAVACVSNATKRALVGHYGTDPKRVWVVPEAADAFELSASTADSRKLDEVRRRLGLPELYVLTVGARRPHKNLGLAVRAFALVRGEVPHSLVVVGAPERRYPDDVAAALGETGVDDRVIQIDRVAEEDLPAVYALAEAVLVPSLHEGFGLPALEAMRSGTAVIASDRTSLPEVVGEAGLLVDPGDLAAWATALRRVLLDDEFRERLRAKGRERAAGFSWRRSAEQLMLLFRSVVGVD